MSFSVMRTALAALAAFAICLGSVNAGEFARPVPSDAQVTRFTRFNIRYSLRDIIADGVQKVEFYITNDMGTTWELYGEDTDRISPMTVEVPGEGAYGFVCVATDRYGNRERAPVPRSRPETVIIVDRTPPQAKWLSPRQDILGRGQPIDLSWESSDDYFGDEPVKVQYTVNAGSNHDRSANWVTIEEKLPAEGSVKWTPPDSNRYNFRLIAEDRAGNMAVAYNPATISVDNTAPFIQSVSPLRSNKLENDISVEASDGPNGSGVKEFSLYTSDNGAATWTLVKESVGGESVPVKRRPGEPIAFKAARSGEYPLWPVVFDEAGNATALPAIAVAGPYILVIDNEPPVVTLSNSFLLGRNTVLSNESRRAEWTSYDPHIENYSASIQLSLDNGRNWQELLSRLPTSGSETINFPFDAQSEEAKLRVTVKDEFGNIGEGVSDAFKLTGAETTIDSVTPRTSGSSDTSFYPSDTTPQPTPSLPAADDWFGTSGSSGFPSESTFTPPTATTPPTSIPTPNPFEVFGIGSQGGNVYGGQSGTGDIYGGSASDVFAGGNYDNESTATSVPRAMLRESQQPSLPVAPPSAPPSFPTPTPQTQVVTSQPEQDAWMPSPSAGSVTSPPFGMTPSDSSSSSLDQFSLPPSGLPTPSTGQDAPTASAGDWMPSPSAGLPTTPASTPPVTTIPTLTPPASATPPATATATPSLPAFDESAFGGDFMAPPPVPQQSEPLAPSQTDGTSSPFGSFDGFPDMGTPPALPPLPGAEQQQTSATMPPLGSGLRPPSDVTPQPDVAAAPAMPQTQSIPAPTPFQSQTPSLPALPGSDDSGDRFTPPPLQPPTQRPVNTRQESDRLVKDAKGFREDGMMDQALDRATKAASADTANPAAYMELSQINARLVPPDFPRAANSAKEAATLQPDWETWWNCADVYYIWSHTTNKEIQNMFRSGRTPPIDLVDERNRTLDNAGIAITNAAHVLPPGNSEAAKKVTITNGMVAYLRALTIPEPARPAETGGPIADEYRRQQGTYKANVMPRLQEALPYFQNARTMSGAPTYNECFQLGVINFRLAGLERDSGNASQAVTYYQEAVKYLQEATEAQGAPSGGPREAYYMLALSHDELSKQPGADQTRNKEIAFRYWRQTADFYEAGSPYRTYAEQRVTALSNELGF